jgi:hypothetical protein
MGVFEIAVPLRPRNARLIGTYRPVRCRGAAHKQSRLIVNWGSIFERCSESKGILSLMSRTAEFDASQDWGHARGP